MYALGRASSVSLIALAVALAAFPFATSAPAQTLPRTAAPWNGEPLSAGVGPTYGEEWCAAPGEDSSIAAQQEAPLALFPYEALECTLETFEQEAQANEVPDRMDYSVIGRSAGGRDLYGVIVNALETPEQERDYERWQEIRAIQLDDPAAAQALLESYGDDVKMPIFVQANIHGNEEEGTDAMMQILRDLVTLPRGTNETLDNILDHSVLIVIPIENPDGRIAGTRANGNGFDMNRDFLVQSQSEIRASVALQHEWLAPVGLDMHGYVNPTLVDGLTKPHNPGIEYDKYLYWNQRRLDANEDALRSVGMAITRPVNHYNPLGLPPGHPYVAEGWDDWGPFYTQTYMAFYGVDSSTAEMCSSFAGGLCDGRLGSKTAQYVTFYSSVEYWLANRNDVMFDQSENFRRGVEDAGRPNCCEDFLLTGRGFTEDQHNWMVEYPKAYVIPQNGEAQRSDAEANRMAQWLLDNGIEITRIEEDFEWEGTTFPRGSYVVWMNQPLRGLALTTLDAGQDISDRISQLYSPPAAWSHGLLWGADVVEIPRGEDSFAPSTTEIAEPNELEGGVRDGTEAPSDWYSATLRGVSEYRVVLDLLREGFDGAIAEEPFDSTTGGRMPAGAVIFTGDVDDAARLDAAGRAAGIVFERNVGIPKPSTTELSEAPKVAILVNTGNPARNDTSESLRSIFGPDAGFVSVSGGQDSLQNAAEDPMLGYDVIYNAGQTWPANPVAQDRLLAFFERGGGYIGTSQSTNNFSFLSGSGLVDGSLTQGSQTAYGGIAIWENAAGSTSPVTGGAPAQDFLYLPQNVTYFTATPTDATIAGRYHADMVGSGTNGPSPGFVAGLWRTRMAAANGAPVIVHGTTSFDGRYFGLATNPFSRQDAEREWALVAQAVLWSNLTDDRITGAEPATTEGFVPFYPSGKRAVDPHLLKHEIPVPGTRGAD